MREAKGVDADVGSTFINMGLSLQEEFPGEDNLITAFEDAPFFEILFIKDASSLASLAGVITDESISRFKSYDALTAKILKLNKINSYNRAISNSDVVQRVAHMFHFNPHGVGIFFSKEHQLICFVGPKCSENHHSSEKVN